MSFRYYFERRSLALRRAGWIVSGVEEGSAEPMKIHMVYVLGDLAAGDRFPRGLEIVFVYTPTMAWHRFSREFNERHRPYSGTLDRDPAKVEIERRLGVEPWMSVRTLFVQDADLEDVIREFRWPPYELIWLHGGRVGPLWAEILRADPWMALDLGFITKDEMSRAYVSEGPDVGDVDLAAEYDEVARLLSGGPARSLHERWGNRHGDQETRAPDRANVDQAGELAEHGENGRRKSAFQEE